MKQTRFILILSAVLSLVLLSGCVNLVQEIAINEDGSGYLRFDLGVQADVYPQFEEALPEEYQLENLLSILIQDENVTDVIQESYEANGRIWDSIQLEFDDVAVVFSENRRIGPITATIDESGGMYVFEQIIDLENSTMTIPGVNLMDLTGAGYTIRLITPHIIDTTGVQESAGVTSWDVPLSELLQGGETESQRAEYSLEPYEGVFIPWELFYPYVVIGFLALGGIAVLVVIIVNTSGKREKGKEFIFKK